MPLQESRRWPAGSHGRTGGPRRLVRGCGSSFQEPHGHLGQGQQEIRRGTVGFASSGWKTKPVWAMNQKSLSPAYTSRSDRYLG
ncbi:DUF4113 domain-containing protein [Xanthomonas hortorum]|uniref:DUF4113 domain-containing protein n=1 Tax=Xanthomonas hortorum TaxID=56454 RepID=UPI003D0116E4